FYAEAEFWHTKYGPPPGPAEEVALAARRAADARQAARADLLSVTVANVPIPLYNLVLFHKHDEEEREAWCSLLRDIFGPLPFRPLPPLHPAVLAWQDATVARLARAAYEQRELPGGHLDRAPLTVLADSLE